MSFSWFDFICAWSLITIAITIVCISIHYTNKRALRLMRLNKKKLIKELEAGR